MKSNLYLITLLVVLSLMVFPACSVPTTQPVTDITGSQVTFNGIADPAGTVGWFSWGGINGGPYYWTTPNKSVTGGAAYQDYQYGPPMLTCTTYYVVACDDTGCGNQVQWTTSAPRMVNMTSYGTGVMTIMRSGWNVTQTFEVILKPYHDSMSAPLTFTLLFLFIFVGYWLRQRDVFVPFVLALVAGGAIWATGGLGVLPMASDVGQGLIYAALAGIAFSWFTR